MKINYQKQKTYWIWVFKCTIFGKVNGNKETKNFSGTVDGGATG